MRNNRNMQMIQSLLLIQSLLFGVMFAKAVVVALGAFYGLHSEPREEDRGVIETVAISAPSVVTEACEGIVEPVYETMPETCEEDVLEQVVVESFTAEIPFEECTDDGGSYFNVPLDHKLQDHIFALCEEKCIDPAIIIAMIDKESKFDIDIIGDKGKSYGLMQIQPRWHKERMEDLGVTDLLDPYQNVTVGIDILAELLESGKSLEWALMAYNGGHSYANRLEAEGRLSTYASTVIEIASELERE